LVLKRDDVKESEVFGTEEALAKISMELLSPVEKKLFTVTDVTPSEIFGIPTLLAFARKFDSNIGQTWTEDFLLLRISRLRIGRTEFVVVLSGIREFAEMKKKGKISDMFQGL
jgi:hypothetical protein